MVSVKDRIRRAKHAPESGELDSLVPPVLEVSLLDAENRSNGRDISGVHLIRAESDCRAILFMESMNVLDFLALEPLILDNDVGILGVPWPRDLRNRTTVAGNENLF